MLIKRLEDIIGTARDVAPENNQWVSRRLLLAKDGMGFSMHETIIYAGHENYFHYANHLEAVYCVAGEGEIEDLATGEIHSIKDGTLYALNNHDKHKLRAFKDMRLVCVFNPPVTGREVHDKDGVYPLITE